MAGWTISSLVQATSTSPTRIEGEKLRLREIIFLCVPWDVYNIGETGLINKLLTNQGYAFEQMSCVKFDDALLWGLPSVGA